jgi:alpha-L-fucosidase
VTELITMYDETVGHGAQLDRRGLLADSDVARPEEFGAALRTRYGHNPALAHLPASAEVNAALNGNEDRFWSAPPGSHHATLGVGFAKPVTCNRTLTMEWLNGGQRVEKYSIDFWSGSGWKTVAGAEAIGHKRIDRFPAVTASRVRSNILSSTDEAAIREFQRYFVSEPATAH